MVGWVLVVQVIALAVMPLTARVFQFLPDLGYGASKTLALVLLGYGGWSLSMLGATTYTRATLVVLLVVVAIGCWWRWGHACRVGLLRRWRLTLMLELTFLAAFGAAALVRAYNADIVGQEKFMDYAMMNAFLAATDLPTADPWLAGFGVPYYHLSYLLLGLPAKIVGTPGPVAYSLAVAFVFAATSMSVVSVVYAVVAAPEAVDTGSFDRTALAFGWLGAVMVVLAGNLVGPLELLASAGWGGQDFWQTVGVRGLGPVASGGLLPSDRSWWWRASRVIPNIQPDGITEFPFFSFLLGDLHPHYSALPLNLLVVTLALAAWRRSSELGRGLETCVASIVLGVLVAANTWDVPTFWGLYAAVGALAAWRGRADRQKVRPTLLAQLVPFVTAPIAIAPYLVGYQSQPLGLGVVLDRTPFASMVILFGPTLIVALSFALWMLVGESRASDATSRPTVRAASSVLLGTVASVTALLVTGEATLATLGLLMACLLGAGWRWLRTDDSSASGRAPGVLFTWLLLTGAIAILITVELMYLRDVFGSRMNTVFKFHYNAWLLLALGGACALGAIWRSSGGARDRTPWRTMSVALIASALLAGLVYPLTATWTKSNGFRGEPTLDGAQFLRRGNPADFDAIEWLRANNVGRPVVIEAVGPDYGEFARVSTFSGLPTVLGWIGHELQWRGERPEFGQRERDVEAIYHGATREDILVRARPYQARYLFFGSLEYERYGAEVQQRLKRLLPVAFARGSTIVLGLPTDAQPESNP